MKVKDRTQENLDKKNKNSKVINNTQTQNNKVEKNVEINEKTISNEPNTKNTHYGLISLILSSIILTLCLGYSILVIPTFAIFMFILLVIAAIILLVMSFVKKEQKLAPILSLSALITGVVLTIIIISVAIAALGSYFYDYGYDDNSYTEEVPDFSDDNDDNDKYDFNDDYDDEDDYDSEDDDSLFGYGSEFGDPQDEETKELLETTVDVEIGEYSSDDGLEVTVTNKSDEEIFYSVLVRSDSGYEDYVLGFSLEPGDSETNYAYTLYTTPSDIDELSDSKFEIGDVEAEAFDIDDL